MIFKSRRDETGDTKMNKNEFDLVARVQIGNGCNHDMDVSHLWDLFVTDGEDAVVEAITDDETYCYYVRKEPHGSWSML